MTGGFERGDIDWTSSQGMGTIFSGLNSASLGGWDDGWCNLHFLIGGSQLIFFWSTILGRSCMDPRIAFGANPLNAPIKYFQKKRGCVNKHKYKCFTPNSLQPRLLRRKLLMKTGSSLVGYHKTPSSVPTIRITCVAPQQFLS